MMAHDRYESEPAAAPLRELDAGECMALIGESGVGRLAFVGDEGPVIHPVNYLVDGETIVVRTSPYTLLAQHAAQRMAFEVDELEPALRLAWSVLVVGDAAPVDDPDEARALDESGRLRPWASGQRRMFLRLTPTKITGRRIG